MATTLQDSGENHQLPQFSTGASSKTSFDLEPNPFEQSFATGKENPNGTSKAPNIPASSPQILTPGGRKLPPLVLSPNVQSSWSSNNFGRTGLTPNESGLRTGLTPGGPGLHALNGIALPGLNTPGSLGFSGLTPGLSSLLGAAGVDQHSNHLGIPGQSNPQQAQTQNQQTQPHPSISHQDVGLIPPQPQQAQIQTQPAAAQQQQQLNQNVAHSGQNSRNHSLHQSPVQQFQTQPQAGVPQQPSAIHQSNTQSIIPQPASQSTISKTSADASPKVVEPPKRGRKKGSTNKATKVKNNDDGPKRKKAKTDKTSKANGAAAPAPAPANVEDSDPQSDSAKVKDEEGDDNLNDNLTEDEKRKQFLERNRVAASKCRQRKKQLMVKMETDLNFYLNEYNNLTASVDQLKDVSTNLRAFLFNNVNVGQNAQILKSVEGILQIINQTNYMSRLRGNAPSDIIPTVQPINPSLVQPNAQQHPQFAQQLQQPQLMQAQADMISNSLPNTVPNTVPNSVPTSNNNSSTNLQAMGGNIPQRMATSGNSSSAPPAVLPNGNGAGLMLNNDWGTATN